ncbi:Uncharacterised protein [Mycobacteroides abscessus subsp. abscessus]|nr:Uncharacterised protein [Mycobacteroides abscessus subsp. abscessus]SHY35941.1 Uncharacterised protein [Mycobacteroides abscessus subsp. abscessus]SIL57281.1 Uncharacterised protein [Mycobacteroides abscessus subsp. abscessus]
MNPAGPAKAMAPSAATSGSGITATAAATHAVATTALARDCPRVGQHRVAHMTAMTLVHKVIADATPTRHAVYGPGWWVIRSRGMTPNRNAVAAIRRQVGFSRWRAVTSEVSQ